MPVTSYAFRMQAHMKIHREIATGTFPSATLLGKKLGVSAKTVRKYVGELAEGFCVDPVYDQNRHGYHYPRGFKTNLIPRLREDEVAAVFMIDQAVRSLAGSPVQKVMESVLEKLSFMMPAGCDVTLGELSDALSLRAERASTVSDNDRETLNTLYDALVKRRRVSIIYAARERKETTRRKIDPLHLTRCEGQWYLVAHCHLRKSIRTFVPARMQDARVLAEPFERPKNFDARTHFRTAFGIVTDKNVQEVKLRFCSAVASLIRERQWHPTQLIEDVEGGIRLTLTCSQGPELIAWILSWADQVEVESPESLAKEILEAHTRAIKNHESRKGKP